MALVSLPYCGSPPVPASLLERWNGDPVLVAALLALAVWHMSRTNGAMRRYAGAGWAIAAFAFLSPLCALSVSLFAARIGQHMILILFAAPLIGIALPGSRPRRAVWASTVAFTIALWVWHMPAPYDATFHSDVVYWSMHTTLFGSAIWLWRDLLHHDPDQTLSVLTAGTVASVQMGMLGAMLALSSHPMFVWHFGTTAAWGMTPLADQQLGGVLMWVPGCILLLWAALRSLWLFGMRLERPAAQ